MPAACGAAPTQAEIGMIDSDGAVAAYEGTDRRRGPARGRRAPRSTEMGIAPIVAIIAWTRSGGTVTPGLVDPHTHSIFAGTRQAEVELRQNGHGVPRHPRRRRRHPPDGA